jgi:hypothetical protein
MNQPRDASVAAPPSDDPSGGSVSIGDLAEEFLESSRGGERPSVAEFARRHPELSEEILAFFPALLLVEDLKPAPPRRPVGTTPARHRPQEPPSRTQ